MALRAAVSVVQGLLGRGGTARRRRRLRILRDGQGVAAFELEVADTIPRRARGLMGRASLDGSDGMLFVYPWPRTVRLWMAGTHVPLDAVFIDRAGTVVKVASDMQPLSRQWVSSGRAVKWVLEIAAGRAAALGIAAGDRVELGD